MSNQFASPSWESQKMRGFGPFDPKSPEVQLIRCREKAQAGYDKSVYDCDKGNSMEYSSCSLKFREKMNNDTGACYAQYYSDTKDQPKTRYYTIVPTTVV